MSHHTFCLKASELCVKKDRKILRSRDGRQVYGNYFSDTWELSTYWLKEPVSDAQYLYKFWPDRTTKQCVKVVTKAHPEPRSFLKLILLGEGTQFSPVEWCLLNNHTPKQFSWSGRVGIKYKHKIASMIFMQFSVLIFTFIYIY